ncbi:MAG: DUF2391 family protein [Candidatus Marinimicrobia bacterium]|nr:DUF2391 family protein [Candidatus Neomarinimicrobiota bacterium]
MEKKNKTNFEDILQIVVGASAVTVPVAFSEKSWNLSRTLPMINIVHLVLLSLIFINMYTFQSIFQGNVKYRMTTFIFRTFFDYGITLIVVFIVLLVLNRMPIISEPVVAIKRIFLLAFPASMGAVVVDSLDKE